jgi:TRAP-type uncharacterized transport system fused permease subunit
MRLGFAAYLVPWAFIFNPGILMLGTPLEIVGAFFFVTLGAVSIGGAFEGYLLTVVNPWERCLLALSGFAVFVPISWTRMGGLIILALIVLGQIIRRKKIVRS